ncbi:Glutathione S-transferase, N-terminal domain protein [Psychromonas ingrahamii 37]|uniref:Glutathione S-transferase, N-terminal domain protein n=1 Tax=Psychromonas ingrahamii (strain DSM 17664 / CCUG 51855 / 37) TaxID=357804 RepID=A1STR7_PSYIN|nr:glutathione S-transferase [Psychromonas ingrahamii]ABM02882.1 Glutathione S-transferase, N-terminal domain protein [Psychromonas ingrahamii 37]
MTNTLYSFRRCPYAIRARLALAVSSQSVFLREIILKNKPAEMLALSSKGTVPVLQLSDGTVVDESLDIMVWALARRDPNNWLQGSFTEMLSLIDENDFEFKGWLDKYKYADRFPEHSTLYYREHAEDFLMQLENRLSYTPYLFGQKISLADMAILPFIRQFSGVDKDWFEQSAYPFLKVWLANFINSQLFTSVMKKYPIWLESEQQSIFPEIQ